MTCQSRGKRGFMKKSIYKITNLINQKVYIGQSSRPEKRFQEHCFKHENYISLINQAISKYGKENFSFEIIEEDIENYNEREKFWIKYYDSNNPSKGYNIAPGGEEPPLHCGEDSIHATHTGAQIDEIISLLQNSDLSFQEIAEMYDYDDGSIGRINMGKMWNNPELNYPIRKRRINEEKERWQTIVWYLQNTDYTQKEIAELCGVKRSCVTMINIGKNGSRWNDGSIEYPIRKKKTSKPVTTIPEGSTPVIDT